MGVITHFHVAAWARTLATATSPDSLLHPGHELHCPVSQQHNPHNGSSLYRWLMGNVT